MPLALLKYGLSKVYPAKHHFTPRKDLKKHYDVVIIGGGGHGVATAYYLTKYQSITASVTSRSSKKATWVAATPHATRRSCAPTISRKKA
jgi:thioredoxin reductase